MVIFLTAIATYITIGVWLARRDLPHAWARARREWSAEEHRLSSVKAQAVSMFLFWPFLVPFRAISAALGSAVAEGDPVEQEKRIQEQSDYIKRLERELGIGEDR